MTVQELIEALEELPPDLPVVADGCEISEVLIRDEIYFTEDHNYQEGTIVKVY